MTEKEIEAISNEYAEMIACFFPEYKEKHKFRDKKSQAKNVLRLIMQRYIILPKPSEGDTYFSMARRYAESLTEDRNERTAIEADSIGFLNYVLADHCIVNKEEVKNDYDFNSRVAAQFSKSNGQRCALMREWHQGKCDELISLFPELFNRDK